MKFACLSEAWQGWRHRPFDGAIALVVLAVLLALPAAGGWWARQLAAMTQGGSFKAQPQLTVFMSVNAPRKTCLEIEARLKTLPEVRQTQLLPREETLARLRKTSNLADTLAVLPGNPFPDAIVVSPADDAPAVLERLAETVRGWRETAHVQVDGEWAQRLAALGGLARDGTALLVAVLGTAILGAFWLALGSVRGAGLPACARFASGSLLGLGGSLLAWAIVAGATLWLRPALMHVSALYELDFLLALPTADVGVLFVGAATLLGGLLGLLRQ